MFAEYPKEFVLTNQPSSGRKGDRGRGERSPRNVILALFLQRIVKYVLMTKPLPSVSAYLMQAPNWRRPLEVQGGEQAKLAGLPKANFSHLCGGRLKELFEKSSGLLAGTESFKNFQALINVVFAFSGFSTRSKKSASEIT